MVPLFSHQRGDRALASRARKERGHQNGLWDINIANNDGRTCLHIIVYSCTYTSDVLPACRDRGDRAPVARAGSARGHQHRQP